MFDSFLKFQHRVDQRATELAEVLIADLEEVHLRIMGKLAKMNARWLKRDSEKASVRRQKQFYEAQVAEIEKRLAELKLARISHIQDAALDVIQASGAHAVETMNEVASLAVSFPKTTMEMVVRWFNSTLVDSLTIGEWLDKLSAGTRDRITAATRQALAEGMSAESAARLMRRMGVQGSVPGVVNLSRTMLMSAANWSREQAIEEHFADAVKSWRYTATLDGRTCLRCGPLDGKEYKPGDKRPVLPQHWRCRCCYIPIPSTWRAMGVDVDELDDSPRPTVKHSGKTVHHRDGSTSTKFRPAKVASFTGTYQEWLKSQIETDPAFVRQVLGTKRFELFKAGKLSLKAMSTHGRVKSLSVVDVLYT